MARLALRRSIQWNGTSATRACSLFPMARHRSINSSSEESLPASMRSVKSVARIQKKNRAIFNVLHERKTCYLIPCPAVYYGLHCEHFILPMRLHHENRRTFG